MMTATSLNIRQLFVYSGRFISSVFSNGIIGLLYNQKATTEYWKRIAIAAMEPGESSSGNKLGLTTNNIDQIIPEAESIPFTLIDYRNTYGGMMLHELTSLCQIIRYKQPNTVFEIGTYMGETTLQIAANSRAKIYTLDLPPVHNEDVQHKIWDAELDVYPEQAGIRFIGSQYADKIHQLFGDSRTYDFTPFHGKVDLVLVDGCHHYEFVLRDSQNAIKMMTPDGIVMWHDYASYAPGVVQALNELAKTLPLIHIAGTSLVMYNRNG